MKWRNSIGIEAYRSKTGCSPELTTVAAAALH